MDEMVSTTIQHGFSIAVAMFLLIRMDRRLEQVANALVKLTGVIESRAAR